MIEMKKGTIFLPRRYWYIILIYIGAQLFPAVGVPIGYFMLDLSENDAMVYSTILGMFIATLFIIKLLMPERNEMRSGPAYGKMVLWSILGVFLAFMAQYIASLINISLLGIDPTEGSENTAQIMEIIEQNIYFIILPIIFAPLLEEIIFRKIIFGQLYKKINFFFAAVLSSVVFSILHLDFTFFLTYLAMGLVFAYLYVKTKRIIVPILVHMAMNAIVVTMNVLIDVEDLERQLEQYQNAAMFFIGG
ncbi:CPBP family intramembrane glutamic endopeptidase [Aquisalibacillus elongatus]|uniref:CAAX prenyl protease 2/Lysostaphin resistance protein A-like domain-containing protein n=1 Tax=Aquisalibacillus elongatus TaxID=485577 RepID=A0A3N5CHK3_9BACI|nr:type II CAAX endopeptidase family protein [Aquisalibacillus elongatus]RPF57041.1 hypothetical protein EDC24_0089 [Aquisalibacillus elongatus]